MADPAPVTAHELPRRRLRKRARAFVDSFDDLDALLDAFNLIGWRTTVAAVRYYELTGIPDE